MGATFVFTSLFSYWINAYALQHTKEKALLLKAFAPAGFILVACSVLEAITTFFLINKPAADPCGQYEARRYFKGQYLKSYLNKTTQPPVILSCIIGLAIFWRHAYCSA